MVAPKPQRFELAFNLGHAARQLLELRRLRRTLGETRDREALRAFARDLGMLGRERAFGFEAVRYLAGREVECLLREALKARGVKLAPPEPVKRGRPPKNEGD